MATRSRKEEKRYAHYRRHEVPKVGCQFCAITPDSHQFRQEFKSFYVIENIFPYSMWDGQGVTDHLLVIPKRHTDTIADFSRDEAVEYVNILASYESNGYDVHARGPASNRKSVVHQHTHFLKLDRKHRRVIFYLQKPYTRITR